MSCSLRSTLLWALLVAAVLGLFEEAVERTLLHSAHKSDAKERRLHILAGVQDSFHKSTHIKWSEVSVHIPRRFESGYEEACDTDSDNFAMDNTVPRYYFISPVGLSRCMWYLIKLALVALAAPSFPVRDISQWSSALHFWGDDAKVLQRKAAQMQEAVLTRAEFISALRNFKHEDIQQLDRRHADGLFEWIVTGGASAEPSQTPSQIEEAKTSLLGTFATMFSANEVKEGQDFMTFEQLQKVRVHDAGTFVSTPEVSVGETELTEKTMKAALLALTGEDTLQNHLKEWHWQALLVAAGKCHDCGFEQHITLQDLLYKTKNPDDKVASVVELETILPRSRASALNRRIVNAYFEELLNQSPKVHLGCLTFSLPWSSRVQMLLFIGQALQGIVEALTSAWFSPPHFRYFWIDGRWFLLAFRLELLGPTMYNSLRFLFTIRKLALLITSPTISADSEWSHFLEALRAKGHFFFLIRLTIVFFMAMVVPLAPKLVALILPTSTYLLVRLMCKKRRLDQWTGSAQPWFHVTFVASWCGFLAVLTAQHFMVAEIENYVFEGNIPYLCTFSKLEIMSDSFETINSNSLFSYVVLCCLGIMATALIASFAMFLSRNCPHVKIGAVVKLAVYQAWLFRSKGYLEAIEGKRSWEVQLEIVKAQKVFEEVHEDEEATAGSMMAANGGNGIPKLPGNAASPRELG